MNTKKTPKELFIDSLKSIFRADLATNNLTVHAIRQDVNNTLLAKKVYYLRILEICDSKEPVETLVTSISQTVCKLCDIAIAQEKRGATVAMVEDGVMKVEFVDRAAIAFAKNVFAKTLVHLMISLDMEKERLLVIANTSFVWIADLDNLKDTRDAITLSGIQE